MKSITYFIIGSLIVLAIIGFFVFGGSKTNTPSVTTYSLADVALHNTEADCWAIVNNKVYNITTYVPIHPGGPVIIQACGTDGTTMFETKGAKKMPHSPAAQAKLQEMYLGDLK